MFFLYKTDFNYLLDIDLGFAMKLFETYVANETENKYEFKDLSKEDAETLTNLLMI